MILRGLLTLGCLLAGFVSCVATHVEDGPSESQLSGCPAGQMPCGNGCRPTNGTICCDDGTRSTSSYCVVDSTRDDSSCYVNDRNCEAANAPGTAARFCCLPDGTVGSHDCPAGEKHCGDTCQPIDEPCCEGDGCETFRLFSDCGEEANPCGYCRAQQKCVLCEPNSCCAEDFCAAETEDDIACIASDVCVGLGG